MHRSLRLPLFAGLWLIGIVSGRGQNAEVLEKENVLEASRASLKWTQAEVGQKLAVRDRVRTGELSRAALRLTDLSVLRLNELTKIEILPPVVETQKPTLDVKQGSMYFFSREKPREVEIKTPSANGALRGTEFHLFVGNDGRTELAMFDGEVELSNAHGRVVVRSGEQGNVLPGRAPTKTAVIN